MEGFFGAGYTFEPEEREHRRELELLHHAHDFDGDRFTPGHFAVGDLQHHVDYQLTSPLGYHEDIAVRDMYEVSHLDDERTRMDLYRPDAEKKAREFLDPYSQYKKVFKPMDPRVGKPMPTLAQDPFTQAPQRPAPQEPKR